MAKHVVLDRRAHYWSEKSKRYVTSLAKATRYTPAQMFALSDHYPPHWKQSMTIERARAAEEKHGKPKKTYSRKQRSYRKASR